MQLFLKKSKGFTLIELLVVVSIIGLLTSIVLVAIGPARARSRDAKRAADLKQVQSAMEMCLGDPACGAQSEYMLNGAATLGWEIPSIDKDVGGPFFLNPLPKDPSSKNASSIYNYRWANNTGAGNSRKYCVYARLEAPASTTWLCFSNKGIVQITSPTEPTIGGANGCCGI